MAWRVAPIGSASRWYLPVSQPPASGDHGSKPTIAASVLGDANKVKWVPLNAQQRFTALQSGD